MEIDIIDLNDPNYQNLSPVQLAMVRAAQTKKNKILAEAEEEKGELFRLLLSNRMARSSALRDRNAEIDEEAEKEIKAVRSDLA